MRKLPTGMMKFFFAATLIATSLVTSLAFAQFQNPIQAAKDAYNKAKQQQQQQQGQKPAAPGQPQSGTAPQQQKPGQAPATQNHDTGPFTPPTGTIIAPTTMAPMQQGSAFTVSPHGVHVATASHNGSRPLIVYDGMAGPQLDQLFPEGGGGHPVIFSPDGNHWAYCGAVGEQWTVFLDGKPQSTGTDAVSGAISNNSCMLGFTSNSLHLYYTSMRTIIPTSGSPYPATRFVFDGKSTPLGASGDMRDYAFSPDGGNHAAYFISTISSSSGNPPPPKLVIDGQPVPYAAGSPQWTADSQHLYTSRQIPIPPRVTNEYLLDGQPFMRADNARIFIPPVGNMVVMTVQKLSVNPPSWFLAINGKEVPGSEQSGGQIGGVVFSADGKHYAAHYINANTRHFVFADGKKGREYPGISGPAPGSKDQGFATFTPVTDKLVYRSYDTQNGMSYLVIDGQESDPIASLITDMVISPTGDRVMTEGGQQLTINGKAVQFPGVNPQSMQVAGLTFTADGAHYAFVLRTPQGQFIYVDGAVSQTAYAPANTQGQMNTPLNAPYVFSPDGKHIAYFCRSTNPAAGNDIYICVDNKAVRIGTIGSNLAFSADSNHLFWTKPIGQGELRIFADGKPVFDGFPPAVSGFVPATWQAGPKDSLLVLIQGEQALQRVSITPAPDSSIAAMMGGPSELPAAH